MKRTAAALSLLLLLACPAKAQVSGTVLVGGVTPVVGVCTPGDFMYNNSGVLGCSAGSSSINFPQAVTGGTSGAIPYFSSATTLSVSALLAADEIVLGGGAGTAPFTTATGAGVVTALGNAANASGGFSTLTVGTSAVNGSCTNGYNLYNNGGTLGCQASGAAGVSSFSTTCPTSGPSTGAVSVPIGTTSVRSVSGATDTILATDCDGAVSYTNSGSIAVTVPQAGSAGFAAGYTTNIVTVSGSGTTTLTTTTSTFSNNGTSTLTMYPGQSVELISDGTNWQVAANGTGDPAYPQGSTTSGQVGPLNQAAVTTNAPTYTNAQTSPLSLDTSGNLRTSIPPVSYSAGGTVSLALAVGGENSSGDFAEGSATTWGTAPTGLTVFGVNADVLSSVLPTGAATSGNQPTNAAQASTTSGQTGTLMMCAVSGGPSYTNLQTDPCSMTTGGAMREDFFSIAGQPIISPTNYGTAPSGLVGAVNAYATNIPTVAIGGATAISTAVQVGGVYNSSPPSLTSGYGAALQLNSAGLLQTIETNVTGSKTGGTAAASSNLAGGIYNSSAPTLTTGQQAALQLDSSGYLAVDIKAGAGSGGTAIADNHAFTQSTTDETPLGCLYNTSYVGATTGNSTVAQCDVDGHLLIDTPTTGNLYTALTSPIPAQSSHGVDIGGVEGLASSGSAVTGYPLLMGGSNGTDVYSLLTDSSGRPNVDLFGHAGAAMDVVIGGATASANALQVGGVYNSSAPSLTSGYGAALQLDSSGNLLVNIKAGGASGGTSTPDEASFSQGSTSFTPIGGYYISGASVVDLSSGETGAVRMTTDRKMMVDLEDLVGSAIDASNFGTSPGAVTSLPVNASLFIGTTVASAAASGVQKVGISGASAATMDIAEGGATAATNALQAAGVYNSSALSLSSGEGAALQLDTNGYLAVDIKAGGGTGGTAIADNHTFTQSTTDETPMGCLYITSYTGATSGSSTIPQCDVDGRQMVVGAAAGGSAVAGNPVLIGGSDGTDARTIATDVNGNQKVIGSTSAGSGFSSNPIVIGAWDSADVRTVLSDTIGRLNIVGAAASGAAVAGNPVLIGGSNGTDAYTILTDSSGRVNTLGASNQTATDCSSTITTGGTAQNAFSGQTTLHGFTIANIDPTSGSGEPLWISFTATATAATAGSYPLAAPTATTYAGTGTFTTPPGFALNHALSVVAATTGHKYSCTWW